MSTAQNYYFSPSRAPRSLTNKSLTLVVTSCTHVFTASIPCVSRMNDILSRSFLAFFPFDEFSRIPRVAGIQTAHNALRRIVSRSSIPLSIIRKVNRSREEKLSRSSRDWLVASSFEFVLSVAMIELRDWNFDS